MSILSLPEMSQLWYETRSCSRRATKRIKTKGDNFFTIKFFANFYCQQSEDINSPSSFIGNGPARDLTIDRILEAVQISELRAGENSLQFIRIDSSNMNVPDTFRVSFVVLNINL